MFDNAVFAEKIDSMWSPPPIPNLADWADEHYQLPTEDPNAGQWHTLPYQRGIMDALSDPRVTQVTVKKSARVGYSKMVIAFIAMHIHIDPCQIMVVQPTTEDAEGYSKEDIAPMLELPVLAGLVADSKAKNTSNTILHKKFRGGVLAMVGANSPRGFRRVSRRVVVFEEPDGYPLSAGNGGDQVWLGKKRAEYFWNRKYLLGGTPTIEGISKTDEQFQDGDQRYRNFPCPHCHHMDRMVFRQVDGIGHFFQWPEDQPEKAHLVCSGCASPIEHKYYRWMDQHAEWIATKPFNGHASFHLWTAFSYSPNVTWGTIACEFLKAVKQGNEALKTFVNETLGECWIEKGEAPEWRRLYDRRETYQVGTVPAGGLFLTAGVDVQKDRIEIELVAWGRGKRSWSVDYIVETGSIESMEVRAKLDALLNREFINDNGAPMRIAMLAIDANAFTQHVYSWARTHPMTQVIAVRGDHHSTSVFIKHPTSVDIKGNGQILKGGYKVWNVGVSLGKSELFSWLKLEKPTNPELPIPPGYCHFPEYGEEYFKMLCSEQLMQVKNKKGRVEMVWVPIPNQRNEALDCRNYARAAAAVIGLDRFDESDWLALESKLEPVKPTPPPQKKQGWISRNPGWLDRR